MEDRTSAPLDAALRCSHPDEHIRHVNYCPAVIAGGFVFVSGVGVARDLGDGTSVADEAREALRRVSDILKRAGTSVSGLVKVSVTFVDLARDAAEVNQVYQAWIGPNACVRPARMMCQVGALPLKGARVMFEVQAVAASTSLT